MHYHYIYKTTNIITGNYYIGCHTAKKLDNKYLGSGIRLKYSIKKYGVCNFIKEILLICKDKKEKFYYERLIITEELLRDPLCLNLCIGGRGGVAFIGKKHRPETIEKMREKAKGRVFTREHIERLINNRPDMSGKNNPMYGKFGSEHPAFGTKRPHLIEYNRLHRGIPRGPDSLETRKKKSEVKKGKPSNMLGKTHSIETIDRIREKAIQIAQTRLRDSNGKFVAKEI